MIMRALGRACGAFAAGGFQVVLDGIVGPWFLPTLREALGGLAVDYLVLIAEPEVAVARVRQRDGVGGARACCR